MLKKKHRISTKYEFYVTRKHGVYFYGNYFHAYLLEPKGYTGPVKIGIVTSAKLSKVAVKRNRVKRVFREVLKDNIEKFGENKWIVVHPKTSSLDKKYEEINADFNKALQKVSVTN
jgi:ribonuclease P protein component